MKKILCIMVLACVVMGAAFAQQKSAVALDLFQLFKGFIATDSDSDFSVFALSAAYERLVAPHFSIGVDVDAYFLKFDDTDGNYLGIAAEGRYYPMSENFEKFFLGTALGYNQLSIDGETKSENGGFTSLIISLKMGYKLVFPNKNIYVEPSLAYVLSKSSGGGLLALFGGPSIPTPLGWNGGLRLGFMF
ncbi:DUF3575 domain-containing protein [Treponema sp. R80B11-R83G3]